MRFKDSNGDGTITVNKRARARIFDHLVNAKKALPNSLHPAHDHIHKAAAELGGIVDNSEDSQKPDTNSPGSIDRNPDLSDSARQAEGSSQIASRSQTALDLAKAKRHDVVVHLYKIAAKAGQAGDRKKQSLVEKLAGEIGELSDADIMKKFGAHDDPRTRVAGSHGPDTGWMARHFGA